MSICGYIWRCRVKKVTMLSAPFDKRSHLSFKLGGSAWSMADCLPKNSLGEQLWKGP